MLTTCLLICAAASGHATDDDARIQAFQQLLSDLEPTPALLARVSTLVGQLDDPSYRRREQATRALIQIGEPARAALEAVGEDASLEVRTRAALALSRLRTSDRSAAIGVAIRELGRLRPASAFDPLSVAVRRAPTRWLRAEAGTALGRVAARMPSGLARMRATLDHPAADLRAVAARWLGARPTLSEGSREGLRARLGDRAVMVRVAAAEALVRHGQRDALDVLAAALSDRDLVTRRRAATVLRAATGRSLGFDPHRPQAEAITRWLAWLAGPGRKVALRPLPELPLVPPLPDVVGINKGMTWAVRRQDGPNVLVGRDAATDPYKGDTPASERRPILAFRRLPPGSRHPAVRSERWSRGEVRLTRPVLGHRLNSLAEANRLVREELGADWRIAEFHDAGGWNIWAKGTLPLGTRCWVHINDQRANPWNRTAPRDRLGAERK